MQHGAGERMAKETIKRMDCWCNEAPNYICSHCEKHHRWKKLTSEQRVFAIRWIKAEKRLDPKKSLEMHSEREVRFPKWDFYPEDVPDEEWRKI
jgi:hypothetical protein